MDLAKLNLSREEFFQTVADSTYDWEDWYSDEGEYLYISPSCERISGYCPGEFLEDPRLFERLVHPDDRAMIEEHIRTVRLAPEQICELEFRLVRRDGEVRWISHFCQPAYLKDGRRVGRRSSNRDITDRKASELAAREKDQQLKFLVRHFPMAMLGIDPQGAIFLAEGGEFEQAGIDPSHLIGLNIWDMASRYHIDRLQLDPLLEGKTANTIIHSPDFQQYYQVHSLPLRGSTGKRAGAIFFAVNVTKQQETEKSLRETVETVNTLIHNPLDIAILLDIEGTILLANQVFARLMGSPLESLIGKRLWDLFPPHAAEFRKAVFDEVIRTGQIIQVEDQTSNASDEVKYYDSIVYPVRDIDGRVIRVAILSHDISPLKRAQAELRGSRQQLQIILDGISDVILAFDAQGQLVYGNPAGIASTQLAPERPLKNLQEFTQTWQVRDEAGRLIPDDERLTAQGLRGIVTPPTVLHYRHKITGAERWVTGRVTPVWDANGKLELIIYISHDISDLILAERALRMSEARYRALFERSPLGIVLTDMETRLIECNAAMLAAGDYLPSDVPPGTITQKFFSTPEETAEILSRLESQGYLHQQEARLVRKDGTLYEALITVTPIEIQEQRYFQVIVENISELKRTQRALQRMRDELEVLVQERTVELERTVKLLQAEINTRRLAEFALQDERDFVNSLIQTAQVIMLVLDPEGHILQINPYLEEITGFTQEELLGKDWFSTLLPPRVAEQVQAVFQRALGDKPTRGYINPILTRDGQERMIEWFDRTLKNSRGELIGLLAIGQDVTERLEGQREIERNAQRAAALARLAERISAERELPGVLNIVLDEISSTLAYPANMVFLVENENELVEYAARVDRATPPSAPSRVRIPLAQYLQVVELLGQPTIIPDIQELPGIPYVQMLQEANVRTIIFTNLTQEEELSGVLAIASLDDIRLPTKEEIDLLLAMTNQAANGIARARLFAELTAAHHELRLLSEQLMKYQEEERKKLASELHDEIGQQLSFLNSRLAQVAQLLPREATQPRTMREELHQTQILVQGLINQVREISFRLRPSLLDDLGLLPALLAFFERYTRSSEIQVNLRHSGMERRFSPQVETAVFRIVQEALTNVMRHAGVTQVSVRLWADQNTLLVQVEDQGAGFDPRIAANRQVTLGLAGMKERALACHGQLEVDSAPGRGTCLTVILPNAERAEASMP